MSDSQFLVAKKDIESDVRGLVYNVGELIADIEDVLDKYTDAQNLWNEYKPDGDFGTDYLESHEYKNLQKLEDIAYLLKKIKFE